MENKPDMLHENDAAEILATMCHGKNMHAVGPKEGKIELIADIDGLLMVDIERLRAVNSLGEMVIATRASGVPVKKGDILCGLRVIPLTIERKKIEKAQLVAGAESILQLLPIKPKKYGLVITGNEVYHQRIEDTFTPVIQEKLFEYGCEMIAREIIDDDCDKITVIIQDMLDKGIEMVFCTGGMSVDPDDKTPLAIKNAANNVISYGAPVLPGSMFMLAYTTDLKPICGLPGCVMYCKRTVFDLVLPRLLADIPVTAEYLAGLGNGGLCLNCIDCHFPNCTFGDK
jgi:molybdenum cofactor synthesis domain-containing protein